MGFMSFQTIINLREGLSQENAFKSIALAAFGNTDSADKALNNPFQDTAEIDMLTNANKDILSLGRIVSKELNFHVRRVGKNQIEVNSHHPPNISKIVDVLIMANIQ